MSVGTLIEYRLRLHALPLRWLTRIEAWEPGKQFVDRQLRGPYRLWHHSHRFAAHERGTIVRDTVRYALPLGLLGRLARTHSCAATLTGSLTTDAMPSQFTCPPPCRRGRHRGWRPRTPGARTRSPVADVRVPVQAGEGEPLLISARDRLVEDVVSPARVELYAMIEPSVPGAGPSSPSAPVTALVAQTPPPRMALITSVAVEVAGRHRGCACAGGEVARSGKARIGGSHQHRNVAGEDIGDGEVGIGIPIELTDRHRSGSVPGGEGARRAEVAARPAGEVPPAPPAPCFRRAPAGWRRARPRPHLSPSPRSGSCCASAARRGRLPPWNSWHPWPSWPSQVEGQGCLQYPRGPSSLSVPLSDHSQPVMPDSSRLERLMTPALALARFRVRSAIPTSGLGGCRPSPSPGRPSGVRAPAQLLRLSRSGLGVGDYVVGGDVAVVPTLEAGRLDAVRDRLLHDREGGAGGRACQVALGPGQHLVVAAVAFGGRSGRGPRSGRSGQAGGCPASRRCATAARRRRPGG